MCTFFSSQRFRILLALICSGLLISCGSGDTGPVTDPNIATRPDLSLEPFEDEEDMEVSCEGQNFFSSPQEATAYGPVSMTIPKNHTKLVPLNPLDSDFLHQITGQGHSLQFAFKSRGQQRFQDEELIELEQSPFSGQLLMGLRRSDMGGWTSCQETSKAMRPEMGADIICRGHFFDEHNQARDHFHFSVTPGSQENLILNSSMTLSSLARRSGMQIQIFGSNSEEPIASLATLFHFEKMKVRFQLQDTGIEIRCTNGGFK